MGRAGVRWIICLHGSGSRGWGGVASLPCLAAEGEDTGQAGAEGRWEEAEEGLGWFEERV